MYIIRKRNVIISCIIILFIFTLVSCKSTVEILREDTSITLWEGFFYSDNDPFVQIVLKVFNNEKDELTVLADFPSYELIDVPVERFSFRNNNLRFSIESLQFEYKGKTNENSSMIMGTGITYSELWVYKDYTRHSFKLNFSCVESILPVEMPQTPLKPYSYDEEEVIIENIQAGITLAGSLTIPRSEGPHPVAILISGSDATDRDLSYARHKPFLVFADHLTRNDIAVLRIDDRGIGDSTGNPDADQNTTLDRVGDIKAAIEFLQVHERIARDKIGLIGFSEGGIIF